MNKPKLLKNVTDQERGLAYTLTSTFLTSADSTSDLIYFLVDAYAKAEAIANIEGVPAEAANIREYMNYLVAGAINARYEDRI